jgi:hypothetical protein
MSLLKPKTRVCKSNGFWLVCEVCCAMLMKNIVYCICDVVLEYSNESWMRGGGVSQRSSTWITHTPGNTRRHLKGYAKITYKVSKIEKICINS